MREWERVVWMGSGACVKRARERRDFTAGRGRGGAGIYYHRDYKLEKLARHTDVNGKRVAPFAPTLSHSFLFISLYRSFSNRRFLFLSFSLSFFFLLTSIFSLSSLLHSSYSLSICLIFFLAVSLSLSLSPSSTFSLLSLHLNILFIGSETSL